LSIAFQASTLATDALPGCHSGTLRSISFMPVEVWHWWWSQCGNGRFGCYFDL